MQVKSGILRRHSTVVEVVLMGADILIIGGCLLLTYWAQGIWGQRLHWYYIVATTSILMFYPSARMAGLYRAWRGLSLVDEYATLLRAWAVAVGAILLLGYATKTSGLYSRRVIFVWILLTPLLLCAMRWITRSVLRRLREHGRNTRTAAIIGSGEMAWRLSRHIHGSPDLGLRLKGIYADDATGDARSEPDLALDIAGSIDELLASIKTERVDNVYVALPMEDRDRISGIVEDLADTTVNLYVVPDYFISDLMQRRWSTFGDLPLINVYTTPFYGVDGVIKRFEDTALGTVLLLLAAIPMVITALAIRATSPGPVLFKQRRYGMAGQEIVVWKFRTMTVCEDGDTITQATPNDERVTPLGRFLRRTSIDELPQLFNVLQGRMSLVGPRPHAVAHNEEYRKLIRGYMLRHKVRPGITGWAQIHGLRGETRSIERMKKRVDFDLDYIDNWSLLLDLNILWRTVFACVVRDDAY